MSRIIYGTDIYQLHDSFNLEEFHRLLNLAHNEAKNHGHVPLLRLLTSKGAVYLHVGAAPLSFVDTIGEPEGSVEDSITRE